MKLVFAAIYILISIIEPFKGFKGEYYIRGKAYINKLELVRNKFIEVEFGSYAEKIKTNLNGEYFIKIVYEFPCPTAMNEDILSNEQIELITNSYNPRYIFFAYKGRCYDIENYFYKYDRSNLNQKTFNYDLQF